MQFNLFGFRVFIKVSKIANPMKMEDAKNLLTTTFKAIAKRERDAIAFDKSRDMEITTEIPSSLLEEDCKTSGFCEGGCHCRDVDLDTTVPLEVIEALEALPSKPKPRLKRLLEEPSVFERGYQPKGTKDKKLPKAPKGGTGEVKSVTKSKGKKKVTKKSKK